MQRTTDDGQRTALPKILLCLDTDAQPSVFDGVVAVDAGVDHLFRHGGIKPDGVRDLVYGTMFTPRAGGVEEHCHFHWRQRCRRGRACVGGRAGRVLWADARVADARLERREPTAAAAVLTAGKHVNLAESTATVLGATGPVGRRVVQLLARAGCKVRVASRQISRQAGLRSGGEAHTGSPIGTVRNADRTNRFALLWPVRASPSPQLAPGIELLPEKVRQESQELKVAIDLNAVPPAGIGGVGVQDKAVEHDGQVCYGAIGVGGTKMKLTKRRSAACSKRTTLCSTLRKSTPSEKRFNHEGHEEHEEE